MALFSYNFYSRAMFQMNFVPYIPCNMSSFTKFLVTSFILKSVCVDKLDKAAVCGSVD